MGSIGNTVCYCCIWKDGQVLYSYKNGGHEIENMAELCLESTPPYHQWYFQTMGMNTFGFLIDQGYVYFAIVNQSIGSSEVLKFLQKLRDEFRRLGKKVSTRLQEQLFPVVSLLIASLEHVRSENDQERLIVPSPCNDSANGHMEGGSSTKAPLLGRPSKQEKKKMKDEHVVAMREIETEEHRRTTDRGVKIDSGSDEGTSTSPFRKDFSSTRNKSASQNLQKKWCRQVKIVLAIDAGVCLVLFVIWLVICHGIECIR